MARGTFALQVAKWADATKEQADAVVRDLSLNILKDVVFISPVGNPDLWKYPVKGYVGGRFRGNWQVGLNVRPQGELTRIDPNGGATIADGSAVIAGAGAGDIIWLTNNLPYAVRLEYGHSKVQAPGGMVRITVARFRAHLRAAVAQAKAETP
jgi:hypothetical protein